MSSPPRATSSDWPISAGTDDVTAVAMDAHDPASAQAAFAEAGPIDVVYYLVHGIGQPDFRDADNAAAANVAEAAKDGRRAAHRLPRRVRARGRRAVRAPDQPGGGRRRAQHRRRPRGGLAGRGDDHRGGFDVVRDAALRRRSLLGDPVAGVDGQPDGPDLHQRRALLPRRRGRRRHGARRRIRHLRPESTTYRDLLAAYGRATGQWRASVPIRGVDTSVVSILDRDRIAGAGRARRRSR